MYSRQTVAYLCPESFKSFQLSNKGLKRYLFCRAERETFLAKKSVMLGILSSEVFYSHSAPESATDLQLSNNLIL